ncbi:MAG: hypothetical protein U9N59_13815 [Campylobacterota bacterium]|nr:hypothetical protein [Campylobacterota bacterium]
MIKIKGINIKKFIYSYFILIISMTLFTIVHFNTKNISNHNIQIDNFTKVTKLPNIVKSVLYFESRFLEYDDYSYTLYPSLKVPSYMKFAYE